jgi:UMF1 family MFS transporter
VVWILVAFVVANYTYQGALPFYNAMLPELVPPEEYGRLSGLGTAIGYCGTIVGLLLVSPFFNGTLGNVVHLPASVSEALRSVVPFTAHAGRVSIFVPTALLFLLFSLPLFAFVHDRGVHEERRAVAWREAFTKIGHTIRDARRYPGALRFILASFLYQDAIGTIVSFMGLYAVKAIGLTHGAEATFFLLLTPPAIAGSYALGLLVDRVGPKRTLALVLASWVALLIALALVTTRSGFWVVGFLIGVIFGGAPTAERPMLLSLVPEAEASRFFSLMLLSARAAAVAGPLIWGLTVDTLGPRAGDDIAYRAAVLTVAVMFVLSLVLLRGVPDRRPGADTPTAAA